MNRITSGNRGDIRTTHLYVHVYIEKIQKLLKSNDNAAIYYG